MSLVCENSLFHSDHSRRHRNSSSTMMRVVVVLTTILLSLFISDYDEQYQQKRRNSFFVSGKRDYDVPHPHSGKLNAYEPGPFTSIELTPKDEVTLQSGKPVMKQDLPKENDKDAAGGAVCVQDIDAPKEAVLNQILDLDNYKDKVAAVSSCNNYSVQKLADDTFNMKTNMIVKVLPGYKFRNHYDHIYTPKKNSVTWKLDYAKTSDFDDVSGHWHVEDHPHKNGCSRLFYACDIKLRTAVPKPVMNIVGKSSLRQATSWVKKESELHPQRGIPLEYEVGSNPDGGDTSDTDASSVTTTNTSARGGGGWGIPGIGAKTFMETK